MIKYLPFILSLATSMELTSLELFDDFGTDQMPMGVADNTLNHELKYPELHLNRLNKSTFPTKSLVKTSTDRTVNTWNTLPEVRGVSQSVATTEHSINASTGDTVYDPWSALLEIGESEGNDASDGKITTSEETVNQDPLSTFLEVERLHANTTFTEKSLNSSSDETVHLDPLQASLEVQRLHANSLLFNMSTMKTGSDETLNQVPWNYLLDVGRPSTRLATIKNSTMTSTDKTVYPLYDLLEVEGLHVDNASTERSMKPNGRGILFHDARNASLEVGKLSVTSTENSMITRSYTTVYQDLLHASLEVEGLQVNNASTERSMKSNSGGTVLLDPAVEWLSINVTTTKNSTKTSSDENIYQDQINALRKVQTFPAKGFNKSLVKTRGDKMVNQYLLKSFLELGKIDKSVATTKNSTNASKNKIVNEEPWDPLRELEKLNANSATTESSMTVSSVDDVSLNPWSSLLKVEKLNKSVVTTKNFTADSSNNVNNQDLLNPQMEVEKLRKIVNTTMNSTMSNMTVKQVSGNALPELAGLDKGVGTTERSIIPSSNITLGQKSTNISLEVQRQHSSIGLSESLVLASTNDTNKEGFLKVTVGYRRAKPTPTTTAFPLSPLTLSGCPEEEQPRNFGAYEVPSQRDLVLQVRTTLLGSYRAYHRRALRVLKQMKEATKASWPRANSCHATSKLMYQRCVRRVSQRCELTGKSLVIALESLKEDVMDLIQGNICNISAMNVDPIQLIRILAMEKVSLEFALPGFLRLLNACNVYCSRGPTKYANFTQKRIQKMSDQKLVVEHFLTKHSYAQLIKGAT